MPGKDEPLKLDLIIGILRKMDGSLRADLSEREAHRYCLSQAKKPLSARQKGESQGQWFARKKAHVKRWVKWNSIAHALLMTGKCTAEAEELGEKAKLDKEETRREEKPREERQSLGDNRDDMETLELQPENAKELNTALDRTRDGELEPEEAESIEDDSGA
jgi:hypothetical protein